MITSEAGHRTAWLAAAVVLRSPATEQDLAGYCAERLAAFKVPRKVYIVDAIPRTATGKVQRRNVAAVFAGFAGAPAAGFFCAGEIGPVGARNFLHGFTATVAVFPG